MKLNETLAEMRNDWETFGQWLYWITVMGNPSDAEPWGDAYAGWNSSAPIARAALTVVLLSIVGPALRVAATPPVEAMAGGIVCCITFPEESFARWPETHLQRSH